MKARLALIAGSALLSVCAAAVAFQNEPDGFRGIKWETDISQNQDEMKLVKNAEGLDIYVRNGDKLSIGGAELRSIAYVYIGGKFAFVAMKTGGEEGNSALLRAFEAQFGPGERPNRYLDKFFWRGTVATISLACSPILEECDAAIASTRMANVLAARKQKEAEDVKNDL
jgi:hypothetical protein